MEAAISQPKTRAIELRSWRPQIGAFLPNAFSFPVQIDRRNNLILKKEILKVNNCGGGGRGGGGDLKKVVLEDGDELNVEEVKKLSDKCGGMSGIVELMECLEREAIMGEDEGREASDYNRRALVFDRSSRVFQALKKQSQTAH